MNVSILSTCFAMMLAALFVSSAKSQSYAGLGTDAEGYAVATPPAAFRFPRDHGPHDGFRIEWWYLTANLQDAEGTHYGVQWTLFRQALSPKPGGDDWTSNQVWLGHAALTTPTAHHFAETFARGGIGQAGVQAAPFRAWIDDWQMADTSNASTPLSDVRIKADGRDFAYDLTAHTDAAPVPQGEDGFSVKSAAGQASYYYSQPFFEIAGEIEAGDRRIPVTGTAWLDREWSSQPLAANQVGWDWFSLVLESGERVMAFRLRDTDGDAFLSGTWIAADGTPHPLEPDALRLSETRRAEVADREVPVAWRIEIPGRGLDIRTEALNDASWMGTTFAYWEGPIRFTGSHSGRGYLEMTGYAPETP